MADIFSHVEDLGPVENVRVVHRWLRVPREQYYQQVVNYDPTDFEVPAQLFVRDYITWKGDDPGIVGMVRGWEENDWVLLDATLRYPHNPEEKE
ncbi:MAG: hypothetical protein FH749_14325 [Firmicutes bacterium]|nr:hypothetical protein [Bacillota bacterium]